MYHRHSFQKFKKKKKKNRLMTNKLYYVNDLRKVIARTRTRTRNYQEGTKQTKNQKGELNMIWLALNL